MDSTRYWYDARSHARIVPNNGTTENEYWSYSLRRGLSETDREVDWRGDILREHGVCDFVELEAALEPGIGLSVKKP